MLITAKSLLWQFVYCVYQLGLVPRVFFSLQIINQTAEKYSDNLYILSRGCDSVRFFSFLFKIKQLNSKNNKIQLKQRVSDRSSDVSMNLENYFRL